MRTFFYNEKATAAVQAIQDKLTDGWVLQLGYSGKDSSSVLVCAVEALRRAYQVCQHVGPLYVVTTATSLDNFEVHGHILDMHHQLEAYANETGLPIICQELKPSLNSLPMVQMIGRGKLHRTPETTAKGRDCAVDWKIKPAQTFLNSLKLKHQTSKILSLSGARDAESHARAGNLAKRGEQQTQVVKTTMGFAMAPIKDWDVKDVWGLLGAAENEQIDTFSADFSETRKHYAAGNGGTCDIFAGESTSVNKGCGSRFGCVTCSMVKRDESLESQIDTSPQQYGYMRPFVKLRKYLNDTLFNMAHRALIGRLPNSGGFLKIGFNHYSLSYRQNLLRYILTIDIEEAERTSGAAKFKLIDYQELVAIQYHWAREGGEAQAGTALQIWHDVYTNDKRYYIPDTTYINNRPSTIKYRWLDVKGLMDSTSPGAGLNDPMLDRPDCRHLTARFITNGESMRVIRYTQAQGLTIDYVEAQWLVEALYHQIAKDNQRENGCPTHMLKHMLYLGIVKIHKGSIARLHGEAMNAQTLHILRYERQVNVDAAAWHESVTEDKMNAIIAQRQGLVDERQMTLL